MPMHDELELLVALSGAIVVFAFWIQNVRERDKPGRRSTCGEEKSMRQLHQKWMQTWESCVDDARIEQATWGVVLTATSVVLRAFT